MGIVGEKYFRIENQGGEAITRTKERKNRAKIDEVAQKAIGPLKETLSYFDLVEIKSALKNRFLPAHSSSFFGRIRNKFFLFFKKKLLRNLDQAILEKEKGPKGPKFLESLLKASPRFKTLTDEARKNLSTFAKARIGSDPEKFSNLIQNIARGADEETMTFFQECDEILTMLHETCTEGGLEAQGFVCSTKDGERLKSLLKVPEMNREKDFGAWIIEIRREKEKIVEARELLKKEPQKSTKLAKFLLKDQLQRERLNYLSGLEAQLKFHFHTFVYAQKNVKEMQALGLTLTKEKHSHLLPIPHTIWASKKERRVVVEDGGQEFQYKLEKGKLSPVSSGKEGIQARIFLVKKLFFVKEKALLSSLFTAASLSEIPKESVPLLEEMIGENVSDPTLLAAQLRAICLLKKEKEPRAQEILSKFKMVIGLSRIHLNVVEREALSLLSEPVSMPDKVAQASQKSAPPMKGKERRELKAQEEERVKIFSSSLLPASASKEEKNLLQPYVDAFRESLAAQKKSDQISAIEAVEKAIEKGSKETLEAIEKEISLIKNKRDEAFLKLFGILSSEEKPLPTITFLMVLLARGSLDEYLKTHFPQATSNSLQIRSLLQEYLNLEQDLQKFERMRGSLIEDSALPIDKSSLLNMLKMTRQYDQNEYPHIQIFEIFINSYLRNEQVETLKKFQEADQSVIAQLLMGAGKTFALLPLIALMRAKSDRLAGVMLPEALLPTVFDQMSERLGGDFEQIVRKFPTISQESSLQELLEAEKELHSIIDTKGCLMASPDMKHTLLNTFTFLFESCKGPELQEKEKLVVMARILKLLSKSEVIVADEIDDILRLNLQYIISVGEPILFPEEQSTLLGSLWFKAKELLQEKTIIPPCMAKEGSKCTYVSRELYDRELLTPLAEACVKSLREKYPALSINDEKLKKYLTARFQEGNELENLVEEIGGHQEIVGEEGKQGELMCDKLAGLRGWLLHILPESLNSHVNVEFGVIASQTSPWAIPFNGPDTPTKTQFSSPFETLTRTLLAYAKQGIPLGFLKTISEENPKKISEIVGDIPLKDVSAYLLKNPEQYAKFLAAFVYPLLSSHKASIGSDSHKLAGMSVSFSGFTGTLYNLRTLPYYADENLHTDIGSEAETLSSLFEKTEKPRSEGSPVKQVEVRFLERGDKQLLAQIQADPQIFALIDNGGWLSNIDEKSFAQKILDNRNDISKVIYHNQEGVEQHLLKGGNEGKTFTIYGKRFCAGKDIPQDERAVCLLTVDASTILRDFLQSIFRMRQIKSEQGALLVYDEEVRTAMESMIHLERGEVLTFAHLVRFFIANQDARMTRETYPAVQHRMQALVEKMIREKLLKLLLKGKDAEAMALFQAAKDILVTRQGSAWAQYGNIPKKIPKKTKLEQDEESWKKKLKLLPGFENVSVEFSACYHLEDLEDELDSSDSFAVGLQERVLNREYAEQQIILQKKRIVEQQVQAEIPKVTEKRLEPEVEKRVTVEDKQPSEAALPEAQIKKIEERKVALQKEIEELSQKAQAIQADEIIGKFPSIDLLGSFQDQEVLLDTAAKTLETLKKEVADLQEKIGKHSEQVRLAEEMRKKVLDGIEENFTELRRLAEKEFEKLALKSTDELMRLQEKWKAVPGKVTVWKAQRQEEVKALSRQLERVDALLRETKKTEVSALRETIIKEREALEKSQPQSIEALDQYTRGASHEESIKALEGAVRSEREVLSNFREFLDGQSSPLASELKGEEQWTFSLKLAQDGAAKTRFLEEITRREKEITEFSQQVAGRLEQMGQDATQEEAEKLSSFKPKNMAELKRDQIAAQTVRASFEERQKARKEQIEERKAALQKDIEELCQKAEAIHAEDIVKKAPTIILEGTLKSQEARLKAVGEELELLGKEVKALQEKEQKHSDQVRLAEEMQESIFGTIEKSFTELRKIIEKEFEKLEQKSTAELTQLQEKWKEVSGKATFWKAQQQEEVKALSRQLERVDALLKETKKTEVSALRETIIKEREALEKSQPKNIEALDQYISGDSQEERIKALEEAVRSEREVLSNFREFLDGQSSPLAQELKAEKEWTFALKLAQDGAAKTRFLEEITRREKEIAEFSQQIAGRLEQMGQDATQEEAEKLSSFKPKNMAELKRDQIAAQTVRTSFEERQKARKEQIEERKAALQKEIEELRQKAEAIHAEDIVKKIPTVKLEGTFKNKEAQLHAAGQELQMSQELFTTYQQRRVEAYFHLLERAKTLGIKEKTVTTMKEALSSATDTTLESVLKDWDRKLTRIGERNKTVDAILSAVPSTSVQVIELEIERKAIFKEGARLKAHPKEYTKDSSSALRRRIESFKSAIELQQNLVHQMVKFQEELSMMLTQAGFVDLKQKVESEFQELHTKSAGELTKLQEKWGLFQNLLQFTHSENESVQHLARALLAQGCEKTIEWLGEAREKCATALDDFSLSKAFQVLAEKDEHAKSLLQPFIDAVNGTILQPTTKTIAQIASDVREKRSILRTEMQKLDAINPLIQELEGKIAALFLRVESFHPKLMKDLNEDKKKFEEKRGPSSNREELLSAMKAFLSKWGEEVDRLDTSTIHDCEQQISGLEQNFNAFILLQSFIPSSDIAEIMSAQAKLQEVRELPLYSEETLKRLRFEFHSAWNKSFEFLRTNGPRLLEIASKLKIPADACKGLSEVFSGVFYRDVTVEKFLHVDIKSLCEIIKRTLSAKREEYIKEAQAPGKIPEETSDIFALAKGLSLYEKYCKEVLPQAQLLLEKSQVVVSLLKTKSIAAQGFEKEVLIGAKDFERMAYAVEKDLEKKEDLSEEGIKVWFQKTIIPINETVSKGLALFRERFISKVLPGIKRCAEKLAAEGVKMPKEALEIEWNESSVKSFLYYATVQKWVSSVEELFRQSRRRDLSETQEFILKAVLKNLPSSISEAFIPIIQKHTDIEAFVDEKGSLGNLRDFAPFVPELLESLSHLDQGMILEQKEEDPEQFFEHLVQAVVSSRGEAIEKAVQIMKEKTEKKLTFLYTMYNGSFAQFPSLPLSGYQNPINVHLVEFHKGKAQLVRENPYCKLLENAFSFKIVGEGEDLSKYSIQLLGVKTQNIQEAFRSYTILEQEIAYFERVSKMSERELSELGKEMQADIKNISRILQENPTLSPTFSRLLPSMGWYIEKGDFCTYILFRRHFFEAARQQLVAAGKYDIADQYLLSIDKKTR